MEGIERQNEIYLSFFEEYLDTYGVSKRVQEKYLADIEYYLNEFLVKERQKSMRSGIRELHVFFMEYFYENDVLASLDVMDRIIKSIKIFYRCMYEYGCIDNELYASLEWLIKEEKEMWVNEFKKNCEIDNQVTESFIEDLLN